MQKGKPSGSKQQQQQHRMPGASSVTSYVAASTNETTTTTLMVLMVLAMGKGSKDCLEMILNIFRISGDNRQQDEGQNSIKWKVNPSPCQAIFDKEDADTCEARRRACPPLQEPHTLDTLHFHFSLLEGLKGQEEANTRIHTPPALPRADAVP